VEADAAEEGAAPRESERAVEAGDVGGRAGNVFPAAVGHGVSFSIAVENSKASAPLSECHPKLRMKVFPYLQSPSPFPWKQMLPKKGPLHGNRSGPWRRGMWVGRAGNVLPAAVGHGVSFSIAVEIGKLELIIPDEIFRIQRRALRFPNATPICV